MEVFELAYYLDGPQLRLLLSLIDGRAVMGVPPVEEPESWQAVSLSLLEAGRLRCHGERLVMDQELSGLLLGIKDASRVYMVFGKRPDPFALTLYGGRPPVLLEHLPERRVRLSQAEADALPRLTEDCLFPSSPMPEALLASLPDDPALQACLAAWEGQAVLLEDPPARWMDLPQVRGVIDRWTPEGHSRWIWAEDALAGAVLRQDRDGIHAALDTPSRRRELAAELEWEA